MESINDFLAWSRPCADVDIRALLVPPIRRQPNGFSVNQVCPCPDFADDERVIHGFDPFTQNVLAGLQRSVIWLVRV